MNGSGEEMGRAAIRAVVFDAYGTLVRIRDRRRPFRALVELGRRQGRQPRPDDARRIMTAPLGLSEAARLLGIDLPKATLAGLEADVQAELASVELFPDALPAIALLRGASMRLALCSNLAAPYAAPLRALLPELDVWALSFEVGLLKPDPGMYRWVCGRLGLAPGEVLMLGDTLEHDCLGARRQGLRALHVVRNHEQACGRQPGATLETLARQLTEGHHDWPRGADAA